MPNGDIVEAGRRIGEWPWSKAGAKSIHSTDRVGLFSTSKICIYSATKAKPNDMVDYKARINIFPIRRSSSWQHVSSEQLDISLFQASAHTVLKPTMYGPFFFAFFFLLEVARCLSNSGSRLLVVVEEAAEKSKYSKFWGDLEGKAFLIYDQCNGIMTRQVL